MKSDGAPKVATAPTAEQNEQAFAGFVQDLTSWRGDATVAADLRKRASTLPLPKRKPASDAERTAFFVRSLYQAKGGLELTRKPELAALLGPFVGDPALLPEGGQWPWKEVLSLPDAEVVRWLALLEYAVPDASVRRFVSWMFETRKRTTWLPAARTLARLGLLDDTLRDSLARRWTACFPTGLPAKEWKQQALFSSSRAFVEEPEGKLPLDAHAARHVLHAVSLRTSMGGSAAPFAGFSPGRLASLPLPVDPSDSSVVVMALAELVRAEATRPEVLPFLAERVSEARPSEMIDDALRMLAEALEQAPGSDGILAAVVARLREPAWLSSPLPGRVNLLWSWLQTARWLKARKDETSVEAMRARAAEATLAFSLNLGETIPGLDRPERLVACLRLLLDGNVFSTSEPSEIARATVEALLLTDPPESSPWSPVPEMPWRRLGARAVGAATAASAPDRSAREAAAAELTLAYTRRAPEGGETQEEASRRATVPATLLRYRDFDQTGVIALAASQNPAVAIQVGVQLERLLREAPTADDQVRLLWFVLRQNPPGTTFRELLKILRGPVTPLHAVVEAARSIDDLRDELAEGPDPIRQKELDRALGNAFEELTRKALGLLAFGTERGRRTERPAGRPEPESSLLALGDRMKDACGMSAVGPGELADWTASVKGVLSDAANGGALDVWSRWLGSPIHGLEAAWTRFEAASRSVSDDHSSVTQEQGSELSAAAEALGAVLHPLAWPESRIVGSLLLQAEGCARKVENEARRQAEELRKRTEREKVEEQRIAGLSGKLKEALDSGNEETILSFADDEEADALDVLPPEDVRKLHAYLFRSLRFVRADRLRSRVNPGTPRVQLPAAWTHLAPVLFCVAGGAFFILDVGTAWNEVLQAGHSPGLWGTVALSGIASFAILASGLARLAQGGSEADRRRHPVARSFVRVLPMYVGTLLIAAVVCALVLLTLDGTATRQFIDSAGKPVDLSFARQLTLWTFLSQFFALFLGLILQGRRLTSGE